MTVNAELAELLTAVAKDIISHTYARTHGAVDNHALLAHSLGEAKGVENFIKSITASPVSAKSPR